MSTPKEMASPTGPSVRELLREYEIAHATWFNTSVFTEAGRVAKQKSEEAFQRYWAAWKAAQAKNSVNP